MFTLSETLICRLQKRPDYNFNHLFHNIQDANFVKTGFWNSTLILTIDKFSSSIITKHLLQGQHQFKINEHAYKHVTSNQASNLLVK